MYYKQDYTHTHTLYVKYIQYAQSECRHQMSCNASSKSYRFIHAFWLWFNEIPKKKRIGISHRHRFDMCVCIALLPNAEETKKTNTHSVRIFYRRIKNACLAKLPSSSCQFHIVFAAACTTCSRVRNTLFRSTTFDIYNRMKCSVFVLFFIFFHCWIEYSHCMYETAFFATLTLSACCECKMRL